jgi:hypothetical protein
LSRSRHLIERDRIVPPASTPVARVSAMRVKEG